jgi:predicted dehydrogenase
MRQTSTTPEPLRGAIIGFGNMAERGHLPGWLRERRISLLAVCDPSPERRKTAGQILPWCRIYSSADSLLERERLDFVDICTPPPSHAANIAAALRAGVHVLCEKPFVQTPAEFRGIQRLCRQQRRIAFPVHNWKHAPILMRAGEWIRQGLLGKVLHSEFHTLRTRPAVGLTAWRGQKEQAGGGGILLDHGWHGIYLLLNFHRERPTGVSAWMDAPVASAGQAEETAQLLLEFPSSTGALYLTWQASQRYNSARVYGDRGMITLEDNRLTLHLPGKRPHHAIFRSPLSRGSHHPEWFAPVVDSFLSAMEHPEEALRELEEARLCLEIIRLGYLSARGRGKRLEVT